MTGSHQDQRRSDVLLQSLRGLHPVLIDLSLGRITALLDDLGGPHRKLPPVVHVAGTNGKGSVVAFLSAIFHEAGLRVHSYTSPHLVDFHERIRLAGPDGAAEPIPEDTLVDVLTRVQAVNADAPLTFFEITTAAGFVAFAEHPADVLILEVGLGGRLDATNVVDAPTVTVITQVAIDHADKLGNTLGQIAGEKAGILKAGVPAIVGPQESEAREEIVVRAHEVGADLTAWGVDFDAYPQGGRLVFQGEDELLDLPMPALRGRHQVINAGIAIAAARAFAAATKNADRINEAAIAKGLQQVSWPARMTSLAGGRLSKLISPDDELWLDGGHNPAAGQAIAQTLGDLEDRAPKPTFLICGMMAHKAVEGYLEPFAGLVREVVAIPVEGGLGPAMDPEELANCALAVGLESRTAETIDAALKAIVESYPAPRRILICGSLYLAGTVLAYERGTAKTAN